MPASTFLIGTATEEAGGGVWLSFLAAAVLSALTAVCYCELASMFPKAGAEYEYTRQALPAWVAFVVGWVMIAGLVVAAATVSLGFGQYLQQFLDIEPRIGGLALLAATTAIALSGIRSSARFTLVLSAVQVGGLLLVVAIGAPHISHVDLRNSAGLSGVLAGAALVFFAFIGFDEVITLAEETKDPTRTVPRALLTALGISTVLYILVAVVSLGVLGPDALAASPRPLADVIGHVTGGPSANFVAAIALASTTNTTLLALTAGSRLTYGMASSGVLPKLLGRVLSAAAVPVPAIVACAAIAAVFAFFGGIGTIAAVTDFAVFVVFLAVNGTVIILRFRQPGCAQAVSCRAKPGQAPRTRAARNCGHHPDDDAPRTGVHRHRSPADGRGFGGRLLDSSGAASLRSVALSRVQCGPKAHTMAG